MQDLIENRIPFPYNQSYVSAFLVAAALMGSFMTPIWLARCAECSRNTVSTWAGSCSSWDRNNNVISVVARDWLVWGKSWFVLVIATYIRAYES